MTTPQHPYTNKLPYTLTTWRECVVWCACEDGGWRECVAQVYGVFAIHQDFNDSRYFALTHIPTGKRITYGWRFTMAHYSERLTALGDWNTRSVGKLKALREAM